ncbi:GFA family protein [Devosia riboflavina]
MTQSTRLNCSCGQFEMVVTGEPFIATECHCNSCREAGERMAKLPLARPMLEDNGGTRFVLYRKDRVEITKGKELLRAHRLSGTAPTRRVVTTCCNSPVFLRVQGRALAECLFEHVAGWAGSAAQHPDNDQRSRRGCGAGCCDSVRHLADRGVLREASYGLDRHGLQGAHYRDQG